jgi:hypothetical protein
MIRGFLESLDVPDTVENIYICIFLFKYEHFLSVT